MAWDFARCTRCRRATTRLHPKSATTPRTLGCALRPSVAAWLQGPAAWHRCSDRHDALRTPEDHFARPDARESAGPRDQGGPPTACPRDNAGKHPRWTASLPARKCLRSEARCRSQYAGSRSAFSVRARAVQHVRSATRAELEAG